MREEVRVRVDVGDEDVDLRGRVGQGAAGAEGFGRWWVVARARRQVGEGGEEPGAGGGC